VRIAKKRLKTPISIKKYCQLWKFSAMPCQIEPVAAARIHFAGCQKKSADLFGTEN